MMYRRVLTIIVTMLMSVVTAVFGADVRTVSGEFTYYGDDNTSPKEARQRALEGARLAALAREFGTTMMQSTISDESIRGDVENTFFKSLSSTEVMGEWIADIGEPEYKVSYDSDGNMVVYCKVKGQARPVANQAADITALVLRNGSEAKYADTHFRNGDDMRLYFKSPIDGYLVVYMCGDDRMAYTMLPYVASPDGCVKIRHGKEYVFFDPQAAPPEERDQVDDMTLVTDQIVEHDRFYVIFSPKPFVKPNDSYTDESTPRSLPFNQFYKWLTNMRKNDPSVAMRQIDITINGNPE